MVPSQMPRPMASEGPRSKPMLPHENQAYKNHLWITFFSLSAPSNIEKYFKAVQKEYLEKLTRLGFPKVYQSYVDSQDWILYFPGSKFCNNLFLFFFRCRYNFLTFFYKISIASLALSWHENLLSLGYPPAFVLANSEKQQKAWPSNTDLGLFMWKSGMWRKNLRRNSITSELSEV